MSSSAWRPAYATWASGADRAGGLPAVVQAPTGTGKTGIILAWLWRRLYGPMLDPHIAAAAVCAAAEAFYVEQVAGEAERLAGEPRAGR